MTLLTAEEKVFLALLIKYSALDVEYVALKDDNDTRFLKLFTQYEICTDYSGYLNKFVFKNMKPNYKYTIKELGLDE